MSEDFKKLEQRITVLESKNVKNDKKTKTPRKPSDYNIFMSEYMTKHKDPKKKHKELFAESVKAWNAKKT